MRVRSFATLMVVGVLSVVELRAQGPSKPPEPVSKPVASVKPVVGTWEVRYIDDSTMKLTLLEESLTFVTPHGTLQIPVRDIKKIEFGARLSATDQKAIDAAVADLGSTDNAKREASKVALAEIGPKALPALNRARKLLTGDTRAQFAQVAESLSAQSPDRKSFPRDTDIIHTDESIIAGRLALPALRVNTFQFGEQKLKVTDVLVMQFGKLTRVAALENVQMIDASQIVSVALTMVGKTVGVRVTGVNNSSVWGSGPYTSDSSIGMAAVHAGVLKVGETGVVRIQFLPNMQQYDASTRNGISTSPFGPFHAGSFEIIKGP